MTDLQSLLGYSKGSPYAGNPYLDINTPDGLIDMSNTPIDLIGIDNKGNKKKMKAGRKNPYKFQGNIVREIPAGYHQMPDGSIMSDAEMQQYQLGGQLPPIYTSDKNDPRLRAYSDSLKLYNKTKSFETTKFHDVWKKILLTDKQKEAYQKKAKLANSINDADYPDLIYHQNIAPYKDIKSENMMGNEVMYKKPVQPVVYQERPKQTPFETIPTDRSIDFGDIQGNNHPFFDVNKPIKTNYSFTYRTPEGNQESQYFPDFDSWQEYTNPYIGKGVNTNVAGDKSSAQAFGYHKPKLQFGGDIQGMGINREIEKRLYNYKQSQNPYNSIEHLSSYRDKTPIDVKRSEQLMEQAYRDNPFLGSPSMPQNERFVEKNREFFTEVLPVAMAVSSGIGIGRNLLKSAIGASEKTMLEFPVQNVGRGRNIQTMRGNIGWEGAIDKKINPNFDAEGYINNVGFIPKRKKGGIIHNPYQQGGYSKADLYKFLFSDDNDEVNDDVEENDNTAPSEEEVLQQNPQQEEQEPDDYEMALQLAMQQDELQVTRRNPYSDVQGGADNVSMPGTNPYTTSAATTVNNPSKYAFEFFNKKGLPPHVSAGIVGNLMQESGNFRPDVITDDVKGDNGASHGIAQWNVSKRHDRWTPFLNWAASNKMNPKDLNTQLEYVYVEASQRGDLQKVMRAKTSSEAANLFAEHYERPKYIDKNRARNARQLYPD